MNRQVRNEIPSEGEQPPQQSGASPHPNGAPFESELPPHSDGYDGDCETEGDELPSAQNDSHSFADVLESTFVDRTIAAARLEFSQLEEGNLPLNRSNSLLEFATTAAADDLGSFQPVENEPSDNAAYIEAVQNIVAKVKLDREFDISVTNGESSQPPEGESSDFDAHKGESVRKYVRKAKADYESNKRVALGEFDIAITSGGSSLEESRLSSDHSDANPLSQLAKAAAVANSKSSRAYFYPHKHIVTLASAKMAKDGAAVDELRHPIYFKKMTDHPLTRLNTMKTDETIRPEGTQSGNSGGIDRSQALASTPDSQNERNDGRRLQLKVSGYLFRLVDDETRMVDADDVEKYLKYHDPICEVNPSDCRAFDYIFDSDELFLGVIGSIWPDVRNSKAEN